ncbi:MAG: GNAT family N-acetyltransferase [Opitutaceae bacterium]
MTSPGRKGQTADHPIRAFREEDADAVAGVWHRSGRAAYPYLSTWQSFTLHQATLVFREHVAPRCRIWVGLNGKTIVTFLAMSGSTIDRLYVDPLHWRQGWGSRWVEFAKSVSPNGLGLFTHQENTMARALYEKHGFKAVRFGVSPPPESAPDVTYRWEP